MIPSREKRIQRSEIYILPSPLASVSSSTRTSLPSHVSRCPSQFADSGVVETILEELLQRAFYTVENMELEEGEETAEEKESQDGGTSLQSLPVSPTEQNFSQIDLSCGIGLYDLPDHLLESVLQKLPYAAVSRAGATSRRLRRAAAAVLRRELRSLVPRMEAMMERVEALVRQQLTEGASLVPVMGRLMLHTLLRLLLGEARVLRAVFWRYVRDDHLAGSPALSAAGDGPLLCFPGGELLDEVERLLAQAAAAARAPQADVEPEAASALFTRVESFLDYFEAAVEPLLRPRSVHTPFGVKVLDLLSACESADCALSVTHAGGVAGGGGAGAADGGGGFVSAMRFELRDVSSVESPPPFDRRLPVRARLRMLARYLRNNVRWANFFRPMRELWDLQDEIENRYEARPGLGERRDISRHHPLHQEVMEAVRDKVLRREAPVLPPLPRSSSDFLPPRPPRRPRFSYQQEWLPESGQQPALCRETFARRGSPPPGRAPRLGLCCELQLAAAHKGLLPLDLEFLDDRRVRGAATHPGLTPCSSEDHATSPVSPLQQSQPRPPLLLVIRDNSVDWGPWYRIRLANPPSSSDHALVQGPWEDRGEALRDGGVYGFRGEVRVTFPPRALSSIVTETVIVVRDTDSHATLTSDRRFV